MFFAGVMVELDESSYSFLETEEQPQICASITSGQLEREMILTLNFLPLSTNDFNSETLTLQFSEQKLMDCVDVGIVHDGLFEDDESFTVELTNSKIFPLCGLGFPMLICSSLTMTVKIYCV